MLTEMTIFYDKLYIVLDTDLIKKINKIIGGDNGKTVSYVQRYYILREVRSQMLKYLNENFDRENDLPYIDFNASVTPILVDGEQIKAKNFEDVLLNYPFIEKGAGEDTYKGLPMYRIIK